MEKGRDPSTTRKKILVLCVDRDDDLGVKAKVQTPVIGRRDNEVAATRLAVKDPEDADANAMFAAIKVYDELKSRSESDTYQIATIAGSSLRGVQADQKLSDELEEVLSKFRAESTILVSDGYTDWDMTPIISSRLPVTSIKRVVIRHSKSMELSWAIFLGYIRSSIKAIMENPHYARLALGIPGIVLVVVALLSFLNMLGYAFVTTVAILGALLLARAFGMELKIPTLPSPPRQFLLITLSIGLSICAVGLYNGWYRANELYPLGMPYENLPKFAGYFVLLSLPFIVVGLCITFVGGATYWLLWRSEKVWASIAGIVITLGSWKIIEEVSRLLIEPGTPLSDLIWIVLLYVPLMALGLALIYLSHTKLKLIEAVRE
ncbi:MAG: DUF373 family protein [Candidatus Bathyarchaeia archaeon]